MNNDSHNKRDEIMRLFIKHQHMVAGFLYALVQDWDLVDDAMQETSVYLCNHWDDFELGTNFSAWLRWIAHMRCRETIKTKRRNERLLINNFDTVVKTLTYNEWDREQENASPQSQALAQCMERLPDSQRRILDMVYEAGASTEEIAKQEKMSHANIYQLLSRIRKRLKGCVERGMTGELT